MTGYLNRLRIVCKTFGCAIVVLLATLPADAQENIPTLPGLGDPSSDDQATQERARLLGGLVFTRVTVDFDQIPIREAMRALRQQLPVQIIGRYSDDAVGQGIDPQTPISLEAADMPALEVLEEILRQCDGLEECTWQLRRGCVEIGTKARLSVPAAQETRLYDISDMMLEPPSFSSDDDGMASASRKRAGWGGGRPNDPGTISKSPLVAAVEIVEEVVETIEPGKWDYGQRQTPPAFDEKLEPQPEGGDRQPARNATSTPLSPTTSPVAPSAVSSTNSPSYSDPSKAWARIRVWRGLLIVVAPDFIHRQIDGYPSPINPEEASDPRAEPAGATRK